MAHERVQLPGAGEVGRVFEGLEAILRREAFEQAVRIAYGSKGEAPRGNVFENTSR
jgi:hypothetical protein